MTTLRSFFGSPARPLLAAGAMALAVMCVSMPAAAQLGLPVAIVESGSGHFAAEDKAQIARYIADNRAGLAGGESVAIGRARKALLRPLTEQAASPAFRLEYSAGLVDPVLKPLLASPNEEIVINAVRVLGELGTRGSLDALTPMLDHPRPAVRMMAALGFQRTFALVRDTQPALALSDANKAVASLAAAFAKEADPSVADGLTMAFDAAVRVPDDKLAGVRVEAVRRLSAAVAGRVKGAEAAGFTNAFARAAKTVLDAVNTVNASAALPESAVKEAAGTSGDLLGMAARRVAAGVPDGADLEELRQLVRQAENLFFFSSQKLNGAPAPVKRDLDKSLGDGEGTAADPEKFQREVQQLIGPDGALSKAPFGFSPERFR